MTPPVMPKDDGLLRRRRARNWALMLALLGLAVLFYFVAMAKIVAS
jgi:hypothetical protein